MSIILDCKGKLPTNLNDANVEAFVSNTIVAPIL